MQDPAALQPRPGPAALDSYNPFESGAVSGAGRGRFPPAFPLRSALTGRSLPLQPPPPYQAPSAAPPPLPPAGVAPPQAAAQPPRRSSPTEPRNYGSYGTQVPGTGAEREPRGTEAAKLT